jgi:heat shock protein HtpX
MNAFATGKSPDKSAVVVTAGLLSKLNRDELQGVIAHEISHILNRDTRFITYAAVMLGAIVLISQIFLRGMFYSGSGRRYSSKSKGGGQAQLILLIIAILFAILAPIMARLLYFAISRKREYLADASAARLTRYPEGLASALEKISECTEDLTSANKVTAALYIANPLKKKGMKLSDLTSTHPPISERIKILRGMMHGYGANYVDYQKAFSSVKKSSSSIIPASGLSDNKSIPLREMGEQFIEQPSAVDEKRIMGNIMMAVNNYSSLTCKCGMKIKVPPGFGTNKTEVVCPRCGSINKVESAKQIKI